MLTMTKIRSEAKSRMHCFNRPIFSLFMKAIAIRQDRLYDQENTRRRLLCLRVPVNRYGKKNKQLIARIFANLGYPGPSHDSTELPVTNIMVFLILLSRSIINRHCFVPVEKVIANVQSEWIVDQLQNQLSGNNSPKGKMKVDFTSVIQCATAICLKEY